MHDAVRSTSPAWLGAVLFVAGACTLVTDTNGLSGGATGAAATSGCTPDLLFCDDFDHAAFSEVWTSKELGNAQFTPESGVERAALDTAPSKPNTLLVFNAAGQQGAVEGPRLKKTLPPRDYATLRVRLDMLIERWEPANGDVQACCALWPFLLTSSFDDGGFYFFGVGNDRLSLQLDNSPQFPTGKNQEALLFDPFRVGVWTHVEVVVDGNGDARKAVLRVDGATQATLAVPADFPRPNAPLTFYAGAAWLYAPATLRVRLDNVALDTK